MKNEKRIIGVMLAVLAALALRPVFGPFFQNKEARLTAARVISGEGMRNLVAEDRAEQGEKTRGNTPMDFLERPRVALTFDDGPNPCYTPRLLEGLKERGIRATFFLMGKNIEGNEELVRRIQEEGHLIGNHTYNHVELDKISTDRAKEEIEKTSNEIYEVTGVYPSYIRPPFGSWRKNLDLSVTMLPVFWDVDTLDWKSQNVDSVMEIVTRDVRDGSIILMHDGYQTSVDAALKVIDTLQEQGYDFVTVDKMLVL